MRRPHLRYVSQRMRVLSSGAAAILMMAILAAGLALNFPPLVLLAISSLSAVILTRMSMWLSAITVVAGVAIAIIMAVMLGQLSPSDGLTIGLTSAALALLTNPALWAMRDHLGLHVTTTNTVLAVLLSAVPIVLLDKNGMIQRASNGCQTLFGLHYDKAKGLPFNQFILDFDVHQHAAPDSPAGLIPAPKGDWQVVSADGKRAPAELWLEHSPQGPIIRLTDLSTRQAADAQARELHSQLNTVWRLNSLGEMAATLAHELNQPLGAAASYLYAAQEDMKKAGPLGESAWRTADLAKAQMLRAGQIIRRMRELLTMEMRAMSPESVRRVAEDVLPILSLTGQDKQVQISIDIDSPDLVMLDRIQLQQALVNLVRNAVEASPPRSKVLITGRVLSAKAYELAVEDSGPGIAPDQIERVFKPMTTTKSGGMGLGLSVTRTIVESHGGHLRVGTSRWGGARFSFNLSTANSDTEE